VNPIHTVSVGMFIAGAIPLAWDLTRWFHAGSKGNRNWKGLLPMVSGASVAMAASACGGGLIGMAVHLTGRFQGQVGNGVLTTTTGAHTTNATASAAFGTLTQWGATILLLLLTILAASWKHIKNHVRMPVGRALWSGLALGPLIGGYTLVPLLNNIGFQLIGKALFHAPA
jgi:hypothetical protein